MNIADDATTNNIPTFKLISGRAVVQDSKVLNLSNIWISFRGSVSSDAILETNLASGAAVTNLYMYGGTVSLDLEVSTGYINGGTLTIPDNAAPTGNSVFYIRGGAVVNFLDNTTLDLVELVNGELNLIKRSRELTITTLRQWPQGILKDNELVTITTTEDMTGGDI